MSEQPPAATWPPKSRAPGWRNPLRSLLEEYLPCRKYMSDGRTTARGRLASPGVLGASRVGACDGASMFSALKREI